ncbi:MAG TPA: hypothetical protein VF765_34480 [Polyangiaceae bacterium]
MSAEVNPAPLYVYGDSTPFELGVDFVAVIRAVVTCGVALMKAQHAVDCARARVAEAEEHVSSTRQDLGLMADAVETALTLGGAGAPRKPYVRDVAHRLTTMARGTVSVEVRKAQTQLEATIVRADKTIVDARKSASAALGELLAKHDLPGSATGLRLFANGDHYGAEAIVTLPGGIGATFEASVPELHPWKLLRKVRTVREGNYVTLPRSVGWFEKRSEQRPICLDKLTILGVSIEGNRGALLLGKSERSGIAHAFDLDLSGPASRGRWHDRDDGESYQLAPSDAANIARLVRGIAAGAADVGTRRRAMTEATLKGRALGEQDPAEACAGIVRLVAPFTRELLKRSGASGEIVLRRNLGAGHRDEVFVTTAELLEQIATLPPSLRRVFSPLGLEQQPRSRRAPPRQLPTYEESVAEISVAEFLPVS